MLSGYLIETERCLLREIHPDDAGSLFRLNQHPDILRFTTDPPFESVAHARQFAEQYDTYRKTGYGRLAVILKAGMVFAGWCGLKHHPNDGEVDVGYRFLPEFWGQGLAAETATACIHHGFTEKGLNRIVARIHKENIRSVRVAEKIGMWYEKDLYFDGVPWLNYVILK